MSSVAPITTVFQIGQGDFTVVLYPSPITVPTAASTSSSDATRVTTRTATKSIDANRHQVSTSLEVIDSSTETSAPDAYTSTSNGTIVTMTQRPYTYTSNGGVYTSKTYVQLVVPSGQDQDVITGNKSILTPIIVGVVLSIVLGLIASFLGCWWYRRRRRRVRARQAESNKESSTGSADGTGHKHPRKQGGIQESSLGEEEKSINSGSAITSRSGTQHRHLLTRAVTSTDSVKIETVSIEEGTVTPFNLPVFPPPTLLQASELGQRDNLTNGGMSVRRGSWASGEDSMLTTSDDDDVFANDGSTIARTLTTESSDSLVNGGRYGGRGWCGSSDTDSEIVSRDPFADPSSNGSASMSSTLLSPSFVNNNNIARSRVFPAAPVSETGRSERSNPQTEASFRTGDDRNLDLGPQWLNTRPRLRSSLACDASSRDRNGSFGGWSESETEETSDEEGTVRGTEEDDGRIVVRDDESWVNGSEYNRRTRQRLQIHNTTSQDDIASVASREPPGYEALFGNTQRVV